MASYDTPGALSRAAPPQRKARLDRVPLVYAKRRSTPGCSTEVISALGVIEAQFKRWPGALHHRFADFAPTDAVTQLTSYSPTPFVRLPPADTRRQSAVSRCLQSQCSPITHPLSRLARSLLEDGPTCKLQNVVKKLSVFFAERVGFFLGVRSCEKILKGANSPRVSH